VNDATWRAAWAATWPVFLASRVLVLAVAIAAPSVLGFTELAQLADQRILSPFDGLADDVLTPLARWDATYYLILAQDGYGVGDPRTAAFFPLYPLLVRVLSVTGTPGATLVAGQVLSLAASFAGLLVVHRLVALERGARVAGLTLALLAFAPMAFTFSAVYTEGLFLLITAGAFLAARTDRWALAGALAMAASATRPNGLLLVVPLALLALHQGAGRRAAWLALAPLGVIAFSIYTSAELGDALAWREAQSLFGRDQVVTPVQTLWRSVRLGGFVNLFNLGVTLVALAALVGLVRERLPAAYAGWLGVGLLLPLSTPLQGAPLASMARFSLVLFPLWMWLAIVADRRGWGKPAVAVAAALLVISTAAFATWRRLV
jgi:hypothetical protein